MPDRPAAAGNAPARRPRELNMELLRIVAMLLVLAIHADFFALGAPSHADTVASPVASSLRFLVQSACAVCVDVFVLLSGWYGIRFRAERLAGFAFQVLFFAAVGFLLAAALVPGTALTRTGAGSLLLLDGGDYWFVKAYVALYLFAPLLNALVERLSARAFRRLLLALYALTWVYGWLFSGSGWLLEDNTPFFFMLLYLTARYLRLHCPGLERVPRARFLLLYAACVLVAAAGAAVCTRLRLPSVPWFDYNSPFVLAASAGLLLWFSRLRVRSRAVGWVAASCFAAYLLHAHRLLLGPVYAAQIRAWYAALPAPSFLWRTAVWIVAFFVAAVCLDRVRIWLWEKVWGQG